MTIDAYDLDQFYQVCDEEAEVNHDHMLTAYILLLRKVYGRFTLIKWSNI